MERQVATERRDMPHTFQAARVEGTTQDICSICDRGPLDALHSEQARELAGEHGSPMPRITGS